MKIRMMLAVGPWMMDGTDVCSRIVCYHLGEQIIVHTQTYTSINIEGKVAFTSGNYFKESQLVEAMVRWEDRNRDHCETPDDQSHRYASVEMVRAANYYAQKGIV